MLVRVAVGVVATAAVLVAVACLRLMAGPIDLEFLKSRVSQEFDTPGGKMRVHADRVYAEWSGISQPMRLVLAGLHVINSDNREVATAPSVALSFDPRNVVLGHFLPTAIVVDRPTLDADIAREGGMLRRIFAQHETSSGEVVDLLVTQLLAEPNHASLLGQLDTVLVEHARVSVRDVPSGVLWIAPSARVSLKRDASGVIISAGARFQSPGGEPIDVALSGIYARDRSRISVEAKIDGLKPLMLADLSPDAAILRGVDIALSGRLNIEAGGTGEIRTVTIDVTGGNGTLRLPGLLSATHQVRSVNARAAIDAATHTAKIERIDVDLATAKISLSGTGLKTEQGQTFAGRAEIRQIPVDRLGDYWPLGFAEGGRQWALANLAGGSVDVASQFALSIPGNDLEKLSVDRNVAFLDYRGLTVHYMPHMPELVGVSGTARFEGGNLHFDVASGTAVGLRVAGATIDLTGLDKPAPQQAHLRIPIAGKAPTVIALLARPKLGLPRDALYDPRRLGGDVAVELNLAFPLLNSLTVADIDIRAEAALTGFSLRGAVGNVDLTEATGKVIYANSALSVSGQGKLDGNPAEIGWREMFGTKVPFRQRYELKGTLPASVVAKAGFPSPEPFVTGPMGITLSYQVATNGTGEVVSKIDLKGATTSVPPLGWTKEAGSDGQFSMNLKLAAGGKLTTADFDGRGNGLIAKGQVRFGPDNTVQRVSLQQIVLGRSDLAVDWSRGPGGVEVSLKGRALELARVRQALHGRDEIAGAKPGGAAAAARTDTKVSVQLDRVLVMRGALGALSGRLEMAGDRIASADLSLSGGRGSAFKVIPAGQGRTVAVYIADLSVLLKDAGWLDGLVGGYLDFKGRFDDAQASAPLEGALRLGPYRLETVTPRADIGTLNATIEGLNRAGNALQQFDGLDGKITKTGDRVDLKEGRTSGKSIGLTAMGTIDLGNDTAKLRGVVVPGFALNNLLSNVPLLGPLLTGGKDGGLFAFSYKLEGPLDDLKTDVNMMSAITPGALRELFTTPPDGTVQWPEPERSP